MAAQKRIRKFAIPYGWAEHTKERFADRAEIYDAKQGFNRALLIISGADPAMELPETYSAALENRVLIAVSPEVYARNYPEGIEDNSFEKLLAHEMAHRLHIRILGGREEAMGPIWFYEGFAIFAASQFETIPPLSDPAGIMGILDSTERGSYTKYGALFRYFIGQATLREMIERAGHQDFLKWIHTLCSHARTP